MFYFIHHHGTIKIAMVTTLRKIVTITLSIIIFKHEMNALHIIGLLLIISSIGQDFFKRDISKIKKE